MSERLVVFHYKKEGEQRLDIFLVSRLPEFSRSRLQSLIKNGRVTIDEKISTKTGFKLKGGEGVKVRIPPPEPSALIPEAIPLNVVFENDDILVVDKPAGMVVHPGAGHSTGTLVHAALAHAPELEGVGGVKRPGIVHRLDKNTSGLILMAKNDAAHRMLQDQFQERTVEKVYLALVDGKPPTPSGRVEAPIGRDTTQRKRMIVTSAQKGRAAVSEYRTLKKFSKHTYLEVKPFTGRTHQIRVHLAYLECSIAGDQVYGRRRSTVPLKRHFLHAARLAIKLPGKGTKSTFEAPLPSELQTVLDSLN